MILTKLQHANASAWSSVGPLHGVYKRLRGMPPGSLDPGFPRQALVAQGADK